MNCSENTDQLYCKSSNIFNWMLMTSQNYIFRLLRQTKTLSSEMAWLTDSGSVFFLFVCFQIQQKYLKKEIAWMLSNPCFREKKNEQTKYNIENFPVPILWKISQMHWFNDKSRQKLGNTSKGEKIRKQHTNHKQFINEYHI